MQLPIEKLLAKPQLPIEKRHAEPQASMSWPEEGMKLAVKNTFFTLERDDDNDAESGNKSCVARISHSLSDWCLEEADAERQSPLSSTRWPEGLKLAVKNTFLTVESEDEGDARSGSKSCMARMSHGSVDWCLEEPDPSSSNSTLTFPGMHRSEASSMDSGEWSASGDNAEAGASTPEAEQFHSLHVAFFVPVVNTTPTCIIRAVGASPALVQPPPPPAYEAPTDFEAVAATTPSSSAPETITGTTKQTSLGANFHGVLGLDGEPICQPCAWFWKPSSCGFEEDCRFCHECPDGELKRRKKQKVMRLRKLEREEKDRALQHQA